VWRLASVPAGDRARAFQVTQESELIGGPKALGRVGDFMLVNTEVPVRHRRGRAHARLVSGGRGILDADRVRDGRARTASRR